MTAGKQAALIFLRHAAIQILSVPPGEERITRFMFWRYERLNVFLPHEVFGLPEGEHDFFTKTIDYLEGKITLPVSRPGSDPKIKDMYWDRYRKWVQSFDIDFSKL